MSNELADYDFLLVIFSYAAATVGALTALLMTDGITRPDGRLHWGWLSLSALVFGGCGIWSMHFIGMLAYDAGVPVVYDRALTVLSLVLAIGFTAVGLFAVHYARERDWAWITGGVAMGIGVAAMHYTGMASMRMPAVMHHDAALFVASVLVAILAAVAALAVLRYVPGRARLLSAPIMGLAVSGMHYTGMAAMTVTPREIPVDYFSGALNERLMMMLVGFSVVAVCVLSVTLVALRPERGAHPSAV